MGGTVNHPHLIGVGMSREGYGQQVDKEAYKNMQQLEERNTYTPTDIPHCEFDTQDGTCEFLSLLSKCYRIREYDCRFSYRLLIIP